MVGADGVDFEEVLSVTYACLISIQEKIMIFFFFFCKAHWSIFMQVGLPVHYVSQHMMLILFLNS